MYYWLNLLTVAIFVKADVIVNTVPMNLQLGGGPLSRAFLQKAGPMLQKELDDSRRETEEKVGNVFMTSGCNLDCKAVLHAVAPDWNNGAGTSWQVGNALNSPPHLVALGIFFWCGVDLCWREAILPYRGQLGCYNCYWHLVSRSEGCCQISYDAHTSPHNNEVSALGCETLYWLNPVCLLQSLLHSMENPSQLPVISE